MDAHVRKIMTKARLHKTPRRRVKRLAGRLQHLLHNDWRGRLLALARSVTLCVQQVEALLRWIHLRLSLIHI